MKKNLFVGFIALTALTVTSCTNDEVVEAIPQKQAIEFGTYLGRDAQSRGTELTSANIADFGVFAYYTGQEYWTPIIPKTPAPNAEEGEENATTSAPSWTPNFMYNQQVSATRNDGNITWSYSPLKYWPTTKNDKITFFAYAPYAKDNNGISSNSLNNATGIPTVKYTITKANLLTQADFVADVLYDETKNNQTDANPGVNADAVEFVLAHELTRVNILAKLDRNAFDGGNTDRTKVNVKKIEVFGTDFYSEGVYTFATSEDGVGSWGSKVTGNDLDITDLMNVSQPSAEKNNGTYFGGYTISGILVPTEAAVSLFKSGEYLFLIPANGTTGLAANHDINLRVYYDIVTADGSLAEGHSVTPAIKEIPLCVGELKQGTAYNYTLIFGLNKITLSATVDNWATGSDDENVNWTDDDMETTPATPEEGGNE